MNHNKHNLKRGQKVILDNKYPVKIHSFTPNEMFAKVYNNIGYSWEVMTNRLKPLTSAE